MRRPLRSKGRAYDRVSTLDGGCSGATDGRLTMTMSLQVPTPLGDVCLDGDGSSFRSLMPPLLCYQGIGFGGYSAAIAALAGFARLPGRTLRSIHAVFTAPIEPGKLEVTTKVSAGRSCGMCEVTVAQHGAPVLTALAWFVDPQMMAVPGNPATRSLSYDGCDEVPWVVEVAPFLKGLNLRAVDYPLTEDAFCDGQGHVALWAVPEAGESVDRRIADIAGRLTDIMFFDAFLVDSSLRTEPAQTRGISLDLSIIWATGHGAPAPTLLEADGRTDHRLATTHGTLRDAAGASRASATSQCRIFRA